MGKQVCYDTEQAVAAVFLVFAVGCGLAMMPKGLVSSSASIAEAGSSIALASEGDGASEVISEAGDKITEFFAMQDVDSIEEALEKGIDVVEYDSMTEEEAEALGYESYTFSDGTRVWYAKHALGSLYAHDDGSLNEYDEGYYVAHSGTTYGQGIAGLYPGAIVNVDGREIVIEGYTYDNYNTGDLYAIRDRVGWDKVCFQTCVGGDGNVIIYYGRYTDGSTATPNYTAKRQAAAEQAAKSQAQREEEAAERARAAAKQAAAEEAARQKAQEEAARRASEEAAKRAAEEAAAQRAAEEAARAQAEAEAAARAQAEAEAAARAQAEAEAAAAAQAAAAAANANSNSGSSSNSNSGKSANANAA